MHARPLLKGLLLLMVLTATTASAAVEFVADTIESQEGQGERKGRLYVGKERIRTDTELNGDTVTQIIDLGRQEAIVISNAQKSYMRRTAGEGEVISQGSFKADANPCAGMKHLVCKQAGSDTVNGRKAQKWEVSAAAGQQGGAMMVWLDAEHGFPIRQQMPDGSVLEMRLLKQEQVNGRNTEKWEMQASRPDGQSQVSWRWYDPEIKMNIREEMPGGFSRNLTNIKLQAQPADLFSIPEGYTEMTMPQRPGQ